MADQLKALAGAKWKLRDALSARTIVALQKCCKTDFMKTTSKVTSRGVVTLFASLRRAIGIKADQLIAEATPEGLLLRPTVTLPIEMYSAKRVQEFDTAEAELEKVLRRKSKKTKR